jgi:3-methyl-2-oxobutanoate hydroxymethyltransferase
MAEAVKKLTIFDLQAKVDRGEKVFQVTAVDFPTAQLVDRAGIECILIGDSLGMTALGYTSTVPVTMDEMIHHAKAITRAVKRAIVVGDLPLGAYHASRADAVNSAMRMVKEGGADVVKLEGGEDFAPMAEAVVRAGIPVMAHIGLTPQLMSKLGGFKVQGKDAAAGVQLLEDALALEKAGCFAIVLEAIPDRVAQVITERLRIPTIGRFPPSASAPARIATARTWCCTTWSGCSIASAPSSSSSTRTAGRSYPRRSPTFRRTCATAAFRRRSTASP